MRSIPTLFTAAILAVCLFASAAFADLDQIQLATARVVSGNSLGTGTCFFAQDDGTCYVVTNNHVAGREGNRVTCEFWNADAKSYTVDGRVILSVITRGYVDVAIIELPAASLGTNRPAVIPLAEPATSGPIVGPWSNGCPGGRWPSMFRGEVFDASGDRVQFFPKPGGGRSGSSMVSDTDPQDSVVKLEIVALIAWSTGGNPQQHSLDGRNRRDGNGIAMPVETVWKVIRGENFQTATRVEMPLMLTRTQDPIETQESFPFLRRRSPGTNPPGPSTDPEQCPPENQPAPPPSLGPDGSGPAPDVDDSAGLLRLRDSLKQGPSHRALPPVLSPPRRPVVSTFRFVVSAILLTAGGIVIFLMIQIVRGKISFKWPFLFVAFVGGTISAGTVSAQESNRDLGTILRDLSRAPVASLPMMEINAALEDSHASGRPTLILIKIPGCAPCEQFADTLEAMVAAGKMNQINLASAFASDPQAARFLKSQPQPTFPTWIVYRPAGGLDANKKPIPSMHYFVGNMAEPALVAALKKLDIDTTPTSAAGH